jgi:hypothetical protein
MITRNFDHRGEQYLTAIGIIPAAGGTPSRGVKYRRIRNQPAKLYRFQSFLQQAHPTVTHVNYYGRRTRSFCFQHVFEQAGKFRTEYTFRKLPRVVRGMTAADPVASTAAQPKLYNRILFSSGGMQEPAYFFDQYIAW